jgi:glycosyltransferase involved in cell wall biosynthesis
VRVFHISDCYAPRVGGVESQIRDLAHAQVAAGHEVHVLTVEPGINHERGGLVEEDDALLVHRMGIRLPIRAPFNPNASRRAHTLIRRLRPDVLHVHAGTISPFAYGMTRLALAEGIPVATTWHSMLDQARPLLRPWALATGWTDVPVAWSAVSQVAAHQVSRVFGAEVRILHNGIDLDAWRPTGDLPPDVGPLRCVATMRLVPSKRIVPLIDIIADALSDLPAGAITLDLFGTGPERWRIVRQIRRRGLEEAIRINGRTPRTRLREVYAGAHVFCAPATREAFGIAALEARTSGLVVLGRGGTGIEEFITNGEDGILVPNDRDFARELTRLATDSEALALLGDNARSAAPDFGIGRVLNATFAEYERATAMASGGVLSDR